MQAEVETTEQDHALFYKEYGFGKNWIGKTGILFLVDMVICAYLQTLMLQLIIILAIILFPFLFLIPYYVTRAKFKRSFERCASPLGQKTYKLFASGIEVTDETGNTFLRYEAISKTGKTKNYVYLILANGEYHILPKWSFPSYSEVDRFLQLVRNGMGITRGGKNWEPLAFKPIYLIGLICLIPLIGAFAGIVLIILGIAHYRDRVFIVLGAIGIVITIAVYGSLFYLAEDTPFFKKGFADMAQIQLNDLVKNIEFYKLQHGTYPDSLKQLDDKNSMLSIYDVSQTDTKTRKDLPLYHYEKIGNKYLLCSPGLDGVINTADDIYPTLSNPDTTKLGFIRKK
jgi:hypothetical protein